MSPAPLEAPALSEAAWSRRHRAALAVYGVAALAVVIWSAVIGHSSATLLAYVTPLALGGALAVAPQPPRLVRELAAVLGLAAIVLLDRLFAGHAVGVTGPALLVVLAIAAQYERRTTLGVAVLAVAGVLGAAPPLGITSPALTALMMLAVVPVGVLLTLWWSDAASWRRTAAIQSRRIEAKHAVIEIGVTLDARGGILRANDGACALLQVDAEDELLGRDWCELTLPPGQRELGRAQLAELVAGAPGAPVTFEYAVRPGGRERRVLRWRVVLTSDEAGEPNLVVAGTDISDERAAQRQLRRERREVDALITLARAVARDQDPRPAIVEGARGVAGASAASLVEVSADDPGTLVVTCTSLPELYGQEIPLGSQSVTASVFRSGRSLLVGDAAENPVIDQRLVALTGATAFYFQPVIVDGRVAAVLAVGWTDRVDEVGERHRRLVELVADEASTALGRLGLMHRLHREATTDALTGLPNRRAFDARLEAALTAATPEQPVALALFDLNGFKKLNDTAGHAAGDEVLRGCAHRWAAELRPADTLARFGGDEFAAILPQCDAAGASVVARRMREVTPHLPGAAVGTAIWDGREPISALFARADAALYADKDARRRARISDPARVAVVESIGITPAAPSGALDLLAAALADRVSAPLGSVSLITGDRHVFAGAHGLPADLEASRELDLSCSYCAHPVATGSEMVVCDTASDPLTAAVTERTGGMVRSYAGVPLAVGGTEVGTLCVMDVAPRQWSDAELEVLRDFAGQAEKLLAGEREARADRRSA